MTLDQHKEQFADAIRLASETLDISPIYVEKDYWITKMLSRLSESALAPHVVWKGGTSLSKGYGIIDRFSSDIDVAVLAGEMSGNKIKNLLSTATKLMAEGMTEVDMPGETSKGSRYRKTYHRYKSVIAMSNEKALVGDHVIVEINSFANPYPYERRPLSSFIAQALQIKGPDGMVFSIGGETVTSAEEGQRVDVTLPAPGNHSYWVVTSSDAAIQNDDANHFHFTMPAKSVILTAQQYTQTAHYVIDESTHGHVMVNGNEPGTEGHYADETITLTPIPDEGYEYMSGSLTATNNLSNEALYTILWVLHFR